jgi:ABC-type transporter Mla MlaB component
MAADAGAQVTELTDEDHACLTFGEPEELADLTAAFIRDGLAGGLKVMWLSDTSAAGAVAELARRGIDPGPALARGQLAGQLEASRREGFPGLRVAVNMSWALRPVTGVEELPAFEEGIAAVLAGSTGAVLCQYDREKFDLVTLASVAGSHTRSVAAAAYYADPLLRICRQYAPPGLRIAGELDYQAAEPLAMALAETVRLGGDITINMTALTFIDARCSLMVADAARTVAAASRRVRLRCLPEVAAGFARLGVVGAPGITVVTDDDR